jgi:uncharacterized protein YqgV (UPF0045/DUF77 family)
MLPTTGIQKILALYDDGDTEFDPGMYYHSPMWPYPYMDTIADNPQWAYMFSYAADDDAGIKFELYLPMSTSIQGSLSEVTENVKVYAYWKQCAFDWKLFSKNIVAILYPNDRYTWCKIELLPELLNDVQAYSPKIASMPGVRKQNRVLNPHVGFKWIRFSRIIVPGDWRSFSVPLALTNVDWFPVILRWIQVHVKNSSTSLWEKYCWPLNPRLTGGDALQQEKPYEFWNSTYVKWDASKEFYYIEPSTTDTWKPTDHRKREMYHQRLSPGKVRVAGFNYPFFAPSSWYMYRFPLGEYICDWWDDDDDEEVMLLKQHLFTFAFPNTKVLLFKYWFEGISVTEDLVIPVPMYKALIRRVYGSEDWDYDDPEKLYSIWREVFLDGMAVILVGVVMIFVGKFSKKIYNMMMEKWKWKRKISGLDTKLDRILDGVFEIMTDVSEMADQIDEIYDSVINIESMAYMMLRMQTKISDALDIDIEITKEMIDMFGSAASRSSKYRRDLHDQVDGMF